MLTSTSEIYSHTRSANALCKAKRVEICDETDKKKRKSFPRKLCEQRF